MKVLIVASYAPSLITFRGPLIKELIELGHSVLAAAPAIGGRTGTELDEIGVKGYDLPMKRTGFGIVADLLYLFRLMNLMRQSQPELVLTYTIKPNIWGAFAAASCGINSYAMVTGLGYAFSDDGRSMLRRGVKGIARRLYREATDRNRHVMFQNPDDRDDFIAAGCLRDSSKAVMINGSGVDLSAFASADRPASSLSFLMIGRLLGAKGVREYAEAARRVRERSPHARFLLAGWLDDNPDSIDPAELQTWVEEGSLEFLGKLEDIRPVMAASTVYVLPSYREGTPRTVLEAMAMGRAIITTDAPGCRETVLDGENGFLVSPRSVDSLVVAMERFINDPELAVPMGRRSREMAEQKYDVHKVNAVILKALGLDRPAADGGRNVY